MPNADIHPHAFDEIKLAHEAKQKAVDRLLEYQADTRQRVDTLIKAIFVLSGGALTVSIGIFLRSGAPSLSGTQSQLLQNSWALTFYALAASSSVLFSMICQGYYFAAIWEHCFNTNGNELKISRLLKALRWANWIIGVTGFIAFLTGLGLLAYVAVTCITPGSNIAIKKGAPQISQPLTSRRLPSR